MQEIGQCVEILVTHDIIFNHYSFRVAKFYCSTSLESGAPISEITSIRELHQ